MAQHSIFQFQRIWICVYRYSKNHTFGTVAWLPRDEIPFVGISDAKRFSFAFIFITSSSFLFVLSPFASRQMKALLMFVFLLNQTIYLSVAENQTIQRTKKWLSYLNFLFHNSGFDRLNYSRFVLIIGGFYKIYKYFAFPANILLILLSFETIGKSFFIRKLEIHLKSTGPEINCILTRFFCFRFYYYYSQSVLLYLFAHI